ncbi:Vps54-domain-containing protein [Rickenella mellea]|uniref:Vps54-domain-containing protein n=1 Tax=Rickenella mellea TaxID=50990 RepID=A0A4Y7QCN0_9AGAM|nr:Vps54-domain-containing protein [Rickenella mellea]
MSDQTSTPSRPGSPVAPLPDIGPSKPYRFTWDNNRRPGPASVSGTSEGHGDYFPSHIRPELFNVSTTSLGMGALPSQWSSATQGFNAISTVLNHPHKRSAPPKAHATVPTVPPSDLPRVRRKDFESYLSAVAPEWERFEKNAEVGHDGGAEMDNRPLQSPQFRWVTPDTPKSPRTPRHIPGKSLPPLESVPAVFFGRDFNLGDPQTFALETEQQGDDGNPSDPAALAHSLPLLEKLSHHADTIELHLIREISRRSSSFFAALTNLNNLQTESEQCLDRIQRLRGMLKNVDEKRAKRGLEVVQKQLKVRNLAVVQEGLQTVKGVQEMLGVARGLAAANEWTESLDVVEGINSLWEPELEPVASTTLTRPTTKRAISSFSGVGGTAPLPAVLESPVEERHDQPKAQRRIPLSLLNAFASLPEDLRVLTLEITTSLTSELIQVLKSDLQVRMGNGSLKDDVEMGRVNQSFRDRLRPLLHGLKRTNGVREFTSMWRDVVIGDIKGGVKRHLPLSGDIDEEQANSSSKSAIERAAGLKQYLCSMAHSEFAGIIHAIYATLLNGIQGLQTQGSIFVEVLDTFLTKGDGVSADVQSDFSDILSAATETAHLQTSKVISIRAEQHASLDLFDFMSIFSETWEFVIQTEVICRRMIVGLRGVIVSQAKSFLQTSHASRVSQSARLVEDEQWVAAEITPALQNVVNVLVDAAVRDPPELVLKDNPAPSSPLPAPISPTPSSPKVGKNGTGSKHLRIEDRTYFAVSATLQTLVLLTDYLKIIINLSLITTDAVGRVIEFLKAFNSRTCQVVLGAGAMRSAGLKNITAKHLALASQSLSIIIALIPYVRETKEGKYMTVLLIQYPTNLMTCLQDYQEHQNEIHAKLIAIMGDRLIAHCKSLQTVDWTVPRQSVNEYMELLVKETATLHKVLSRYLPAPVIEYVMSQVFASINHRLSEEYGKIELPDQAAKDRMLQDARYLHQKLSVLKNVGAPTGMLETVVSEKAVPRKGNARSPGESANDRLKGIFGRKENAASVDARPSSPHSPPAGVEKVQSGLPPLPATPTPPPAPEKETNGPLKSIQSPPPTPAEKPEPARTPGENGLPNPLPELNTNPTPVPKPTPTPGPAHGVENGTVPVPEGSAGSPAGLLNGDSSL